MLGINEPAVTIKSIEQSIIDHAFEHGWIVAEPPKKRTGKKVAVIGSGPAGLACAAQLNKAGHLVTVYERDDRIGGLLRYGIPEFKMEKRVLDRRLRLLEEEGVRFVPSANIGINISMESLRKDNDALALCAARRTAGTSPFRVASSRGSTWRWSSSRSRIGRARATSSRMTR